MFPIQNLTCYNVKDYGALGNGVADDTAAIQYTIATAQKAGGGIVFLPAGTYLISATLIISADNVQVVGAGWGTQLLAAPTFPAGPMLQVQAPGGGVFRYGVRIADVFLNGNNVAGVGGLDLETTYYALADHVRVRYCPGTGINLGGSSGNLGAYNVLRQCVITDGGAGTGVAVGFNEDNTLLGCFINWYNATGGVGVKLNDGVNQVIGCRFDECQQGVWMASSSGNQLIGNQFTRGYLRHIYLNNASRNLIESNYFDSFVNGGSPPHIRVDGASNGGNVVSGNVVNTGTTAGQFIQENGVMGATPNLYVNNETAGLPISLVSAASGGGVARSNRGYNPVGSQVAPAIPATTVALTNPFGVDCMVLVSGGTVTAVAIGGVATGQTSGWFRIPAGQRIAITYSVSPSWVWYGE